MNYLQRIATKIGALAGCVLLSSCAAPEVDRYASEQPQFDLRRYFVGKTEAWGIFQKRSGEVVKRFKVDIAGHLDGEQLILEEHFVYNDGKQQERVWKLTEVSPGNWRGTAGDVVGEAEGKLAGNALHWKYQLDLPVDDKVYKVDMDDWMFLLDSQTLANRTRMSKFGVEVGQISIFFRKVN